VSSTCLKLYAGLTLVQSSESESEDKEGDCCWRMARGMGIAERQTRKLCSRGMMEVGETIGRNQKQEGSGTSGLLKGASCAQN